MYPNFTDLEKYPFILLLDVARTGLGAVLTLRQPDGTGRVIQYRAQATTRRESAGSATQLQLACLIQALTWYSSIRRLSKFLIRKDHVTLVRLESLKHSTQGKLLLYAIFLDSLDYTIEHAKGKAHTLPDALSRRPLSSEETRSAETIAMELHPLYLNGLKMITLKKLNQLLKHR